MKANHDPPAAALGPDLSHWDLVGEFTLRQAAMLWTGQDPNDPTEGDRRYEVVARVMAKAATESDGDLATLTFQDRDVHLGFNPEIDEDMFDYTADWDQTTVARQELARWAKVRGMTPRFLERDSASLPAEVLNAKVRLPFDSDDAEIPAPEPLPEPSAAGHKKIARAKPSLPGEGGLLTNEETARLLRVTPHTLDTWRSTGRYPDLPKHVQIGRRVMYREAEIMAYIEKRKGQL